MYYQLFLLGPVAELAALWVFLSHGIVVSSNRSRVVFLFLFGQKINSQCLTPFKSKFHNIRSLRGVVARVPQQRLEL